MDCISRAGNVNASACYEGFSPVGTSRYLDLMKFVERLNIPGFPECHCDTVSRSCTVPEDNKRGYVFACLRFAKRFFF